MAEVEKGVDWTGIGGGGGGGERIPGWRASRSLMVWSRELGVRMARKYDEWCRRRDF